MLNGVHPGAMEHMVLGAGLFLKDFHWRSACDAAALRSLVGSAVQEGSAVLGATRDGSCFSCVPRMTQLNAGGTRPPYVGGTLLDGWQARMTGTLAEVTPENMALLMASADMVRSGGRTEVTPGRAAAHLSRLSWIGRWGSGCLLIELAGALNMAGVTLQMNDRGEAGVFFCIEAHAPSPMETGAMPFRMVFFEGSDAA